jgi:hypothetical protein
MIRCSSLRTSAAGRALWFAATALTLAGLVAGCGQEGAPRAAAPGSPAASGQPSQVPSHTPGPSPTLAASGSPLPHGLAHAPFTTVRQIHVPSGAWQEVTGAGALFTASAAGASPPGTATVITRVDPSTGEVGPATRVNDASSLTFGGGLLWVARGAQPTSKVMTVTGLDPATLTVRYTVALNQPPSFGSQQLAFAGGLVWAATERTIVAVDPATGRIIADVAVPGAKTQDFVHVAGSADGSALWTTENSGAGGSIAVQQRDPRTGAVLTSATGSVIGLGGAQIAAAGTRAWMAYATGMLGGYFEADSAGQRLAESRPPAWPHGFSNSVRVYLAGRQLWITDAMAGTIACASSATGRILAAVRGSGLQPAGIEPVGDGRLALLLAGEVLIVVPKPACGP